MLIRKLFDELWEVAASAVKQQLAWVNAMRLQLRMDPGAWIEERGQHLSAADFEMMLIKENRVTHIGMINGNTIKELQAHDSMDIFSYIQMDDTITRLTGLQGRVENKEYTSASALRLLHLGILGLVYIAVSVCLHRGFHCGRNAVGHCTHYGCVSWFFINSTLLATPSLILLKILRQMFSMRFVGKSKLIRRLSP